MGNESIQNLKTALLKIIEAAYPADSLYRFEALMIAEQYISALEIFGQLNSGTISSYSISGRSVTKRDPSAALSLLDSLRTRLSSFIDMPDDGTGPTHFNLDFSWGCV